MKDCIRVGLIGWGTVGSGVVRILSKEKDLITRRLGVPLEIAQIADRDITRKRDVDVPPEILTTDPQQLIQSPNIDIILELIGGIEPARSLVLNAIHNKKHVVTANKALLAAHGEEIFDTAVRENVDVGFEASVGGGIPIIRAIKEGFSGEKISAVFGIVNGTSNYILTQMSERGRDFSDVLKEAQDLGYAEADPTLDISGGDSAHKLAILATLAYGTPVPIEEIYTEGISHITPMDITFAETLGYKIKLLAIAKHAEGKIEARVHPTMISKDEMLAQVNGVFNAIYIIGESVGESLFYGRGAGSMPTGSAVVSDLIDIARNIQSQTSTRVPPMGYLPKTRARLPICPITAITSSYYLRFRVEDRPGVLSEISGVLGRHNISIASVIQEGRRGSSVSGDGVLLVMMTHQANEADIQTALARINQSPFVFEPAVLIRVEEKNNNGFTRNVKA
jgi:homoserine dehydrogenase